MGRKKEKNLPVVAGTNLPEKKKKKWTRRPRPESGTGNKPGRPTKYKDEYPEMLLAHMRGGESFWSFAGRIGVCLQTLQEWTQTDGAHYQPAFLEAKKIGEAALLRLDEAVGNAGIKGSLKFTSKVTTKVDPRTDQEIKIEQFTPARFNSVAWIFRMKNRYPTLYRDRIEAVVSDPDGKALENNSVVVNLIIPSNGRDVPTDD